MWTADQRARKGAAERGLCVVANMRRDRALIAWAQSVQRYVRVDRGTKWGNPYTMPHEPDRDTAVDQFAAWLPDQPELLADLPALRGKVLVCWCHPKRCHGHVIAEAANRKGL